MLKSLFRIVAALAIVTTISSSTSVTMNAVASSGAVTHGVDDSQVRWVDVEPGRKRQPTIKIDEAIYPDSRGVQFWIDGSPDGRDPSTRPDGYDATGPLEGSEFHIYPWLTVATGTVLEGRWVDRSGVNHIATLVIQSGAEFGSSLTEVGALASWSDVEVGSKRAPFITIDISIHPDQRGVQFVINGLVDTRNEQARPGGFDSTSNPYEIYPRLTLSAGDVLTGRWTDQTGNQWQSTHLVGTGPVSPTTTTVPPTTTTAAVPPTTTTTAVPPTTTTVPPTTTTVPPTTTTVPPTTTTAAPTTTTAAPATSTTVAPIAAAASWIDVDAGRGRQPTIAVDDSVYPDSNGVQFWLRGSVDDRCSCRPSGYDATGPQEGSKYHIYPDITLDAGDVIEARWADRSGTSHVAQLTIAATSTDPTTPPPTTTPTTTVPTTTVPGAPSGGRPDASSTGHDGNLTRTFGATTISQGWLDSNNGGSLVVENVRFTGQVTVTVNNLTIRNFEISGGRYGVYNEVFTGSPTTGLVLEDGELTQQSSAGLAVSNTIARRLHVHDQGADAFKPFSNVTIEDSYVHHLGSNAGSHSDAVQMVSGSNVTVRGNNFDMPHDEPGFTNSQLFMIAPNNGPINDVRIERNWLNGGSIALQMHSVGGVARIVDNRFGRDYQYGLFSLSGISNLVQTGNVWDDTSLPI